MTKYTVDIIERLRVWPAAYGEDAMGSTYVGHLMKCAADEIERLRTPADGEAHAEIQRLQDAKRRALAIADERAKENVALRAALVRVSEATPDNDAHYFGAIKIRLETLYELTSAPNIREQISDEIDWVNEKLGDPVEPTDTPDEGPDPLGYAKGERDD